MTINGETPEGRIDMIRRGHTPRALEMAYHQGIRAYAEREGVERLQLTHAAMAWGVTNPRYRRTTDED